MTDTANLLDMARLLLARSQKEPSIQSLSEPEDDDSDDESYHEVVDKKEFSDALHCCKECNETFVRSSDLYVHHQLHHYWDDPDAPEEESLALPEPIRMVLPPAQPDANPEAVPVVKTVIPPRPKRASTSSGYTCHECGRTCTTSYGLRMHVQTHTREKPYQCRYCPSEFTQSSNRLVHERSVHEKNFSHQCSQCSYKTGTVSNLKRHLSVMHTTVADQPPDNDDDRTDDESSDIITEFELVLRPRCKECDLVFEEPFNLAIHNRVRHHETSENHRCPHCSYKSVKSSYLKLHMKKHEKTVACDPRDRDPVRSTLGAS